MGFPTAPFFRLGSCCQSCAGFPCESSRQEHHASYHASPVQNLLCRHVCCSPCDKKIYRLRWNIYHANRGAVCCRQRRSCSRRNSHCHCGRKFRRFRNSSLQKRQPSEINRIAVFQLTIVQFLDMSDQFTYASVDNGFYLLR